MSKVGWSSFNPHYSSLLLYQDKYGSTDRPLGTQQSPYMASSGQKTYGVKDPEYWRRYRERRSLGFPESAVTTPYYVGKFAKPGFKYYNHMDYYYPSYGRSLVPRSYHYPSYYPYVDDYHHSSLRPYSRYGYFSNWRYNDDSPALPAVSQSGGRWNMDFPGYTERVGAAEVVKRVPQGFRLPVDFNARASSLPPNNNNLQAMGPSVPVSQIHTLDLEVLPANIDANLVRPKRLLESLNIGADDLNWVPSTKTVKTTTKKRQLAITSSGGGSREWVRRRWSGYHDWMRRAYLDDLSLPYYHHHRYRYPHYYYDHSSHLPSPFPRALPPSVTSPPPPSSLSSSSTYPRSANIARVVAAAAETTDFATPLPPPYVLEKELPRDPEREKVIKTSKRLYFDIMGNVGGGDLPAIRLSGYPAVNTNDKSGIDRDGLLNLIKTKGVRIESNEILDFLRYPQAEKPEPPKEEM